MEQRKLLKKIVLNHFVFKLFHTTIYTWTLSLCMFAVQLKLSLKAELWFGYFSLVFNIQVYQCVEEFSYNESTYIIT